MSWHILTNQFLLRPAQLLTPPPPPPPPAPPPPPPPPPRANAWHLPAPSVPRVGHLQILCCPEAGICQALVFSQAFDTYAVSYQNITTQRFLLEKHAYWLICQGQKKQLKIVGKPCSPFYARISSLLIKPELHNEIGSYRRELKLFS